jgi:hypothetical protein
MMLRALSLVALIAACASGAAPAWDPKPRARYVPGQSIAEARICTCDECADRGCCHGEPESARAAEPELGLTLAACGRCSRRAWTVRGDVSCASLAAPECCPGTVSD